MKLRAAVAVVLVVASVQVASVASAQTPPTEPPRQECERRDAWGRCDVEVPVPVGGGSNPGGGGNGDGEGGGGHGPGTRPVGCIWVTVPAGPATEENLRLLFPEAPPGAILQIRQCPDANPSNPGGTRFAMGARWLPGDAAPAPPTPDEVALILYARVQALMEAPQLATNPPVGSPAVVDVPVFVEVTNWRGTITDSQCVLLVCVEMTATPSLEFAPGEPQAPAVVCEPPGSRFDAASGDAVAQAAVPGTCTHTYRLRTGVQSRPEQWPAEVTVRWAVSWTSNVGVSGTFPALVFSTSAARAVDEVQTVVADSN